MGTKRADKSQHRALRKERERLRKKRQLTASKRCSLYIDESGNSGIELFSGDDYFICCGMLVRSHHEEISHLNAIRSKLGVNELHGSALGLTKLNEVARDIHGALLSIKPNYIVAFVEKSYFCAMKMYDCIFDAGTNPGVSGIHVSNVAFKYIHMAKFCRSVSKEHLKRFWSIYKSCDDVAFSELCKDLISYFYSSALDDRSKELIHDALVGAMKHPKEVLSSGAIPEDSPNVTAVTMFSHHLNDICAKNNIVIDRILHDKQDQFGSSIATLFNAVKQTRIIWSIRQDFPRYESCVEIMGSLKIEVAENDLLELTDISCYIIKKSSDTDLHGDVGNLARYIHERMVPLLMNQVGIERRAEKYWHEIMSIPVTDEQVEKAKVIFRKIDQSRRTRLESGETEW